MEKFDNRENVAPELPPLVEPHLRPENEGKILPVIRVLVVGALAVFTACLCLVALLVEPVLPVFLAVVGIAWAMAWVCRLILKSA